MIKKYKGFTLVEMIVVLVILSVIAAIAVPTFLGFIDKGKEKECQANRESILLHYVTDREIEESAEGAEKFTPQSEIDNRKESIKCPSGGIYDEKGTIYDEDNNVIKACVRCSVHGTSLRDMKSGNIEVTTETSDTTNDPTSTPEVSVTIDPTEEATGTPIPTETVPETIVPTKEPEETQKPTGTPSVDIITPDGSINITADTWGEITKKIFHENKKLAEDKKKAVPLGIYEGKKNTYVYVYGTYIPENAGDEIHNKEGEFIKTAQENKEIAIILRNPNSFYSDSDWEICGSSALTGELFKDSQNNWYVCIKNTTEKPPSEKYWVKMENTTGIEETN